MLMPFFCGLRKFIVVFARARTAPKIHFCPFLWTLKIHLSGHLKGLDNRDKARAAAWVLQWLQVACLMRFNSSSASKPCVSDCQILTCTPCCLMRSANTSAAS